MKKYSDDFTPEQTQAILEKIRKMPPEELCAYINAVIKREKAKEAIKEAKQAQKILDKTKEGGV